MALDINAVLQPLEAYPDLRQAIASEPEATRLDRVLLAIGELGRRSQFQEAVRLCELVSNEELTELQHGRLLHVRGMLERHLGRTFESIEMLHSARTLLEMAGNVGAAAQSWSGLGIAYSEIHQWHLAEHAFLVAIKRATAAGNVEAERQARNNLAVAMALQGGWLTAFGERVAAVRDEGSHHSPMRRLTSMGRVVRHLGYAHRARTLLEGAIDRYSKSEMPRVLCLVNEYLSDCYLDLGYPKLALKSLQVCIDIGGATAPDGDVVCEAQRRIGEAYYMLRKFDEAAEALAESLRIAEKTHDDYERACVLRLQAALEIEHGSSETAEDLFSQAIHLCVQGGFRYEHAVTLEYRGHAHRRLGWADTAEAFYDEAQTIFRELGIHRLAIRLKEGRPAIARMPAPLKDPLANRAARWEKIGILTRDEGFIRTLEMCERAAHTDGPVLIIGESGTGKELIARLIHKLSKRKGPLVDINCPAIPETMLESELFGSRRGAFTGAEDRPGLVAAAEGGSLFLDEIGDMPLPLQVKLLRFLESSEYRRVGETRTRSVDTRIISATNADLLGCVDDKSFRRDLYHRLAGLILRIPPLRARGHDLDFLADHFLRDLYRGTGTVPSFDPAAYYAIRHYTWPGNVRELRHAITHALFALADRKRITAEMLPEPIGSYSPRDIIHRMSGAELLDEIQRYKGNISELASAMGVSRQTIYRRLSELDIDPQTIRGGGRGRGDDAAHDA